VTPRRPPARRFALVALLVAFTACLDHTARYDPARDDAAIAAIASAWAEPSGFALSLCEDLSQAQAATTDTCQVGHVVRGGGRGVAQDVTHPGGCGGCPLAAQAYVRGVARGAGLVGDVPVVGTADIPSSGDDSYALPYAIHLRCDDPQQPCTIAATLDAAGRLTITSEPGIPDRVIDRVGPAACPSTAVAP
jgi:hypothetical protein